MSLVYCLSRLILVAVILSSVSLRVRSVFYITIVSLTTVSLQAATERDIGAPEFWPGREGHDTTAARSSGRTLFSSPLHVIFFLVISGPPW